MVSCCQSPPGGSAGLSSQMVPELVHVGFHSSARPWAAACRRFAHHQFSMLLFDKFRLRHSPECFAHALASHYSPYSGGKRGIQWWPFDVIGQGSPGELQHSGEHPRVCPGYRTHALAEREKIGLFQKYFAWLRHRARHWGHNQEQDRPSQPFQKLQTQSSGPQTLVSEPHLNKNISDSILSGWSHWVQGGASECACSMSSSGTVMQMVRAPCFEKFSYSKCGLWSRRPCPRPLGACETRRIFGSTPDPLNHNGHLNKIPRQICVHVIKFEQCCQRKV